MKRLQLALACVAVGFATTAMATPTSYNLATTAASVTTGGAGTNNGTTFVDNVPGAYSAGGTNYGNTYKWNSGAGGTGPAVTMSAWGTTSLSTTTTIQKAWIGNYGSINGFGITSQSIGELNASHDPDSSSPLFQHAIDDFNAYESLMFSFSSAVTLNSISFGFAGQDTDATVLEYVGSGDPTTKLLSGESYADLLNNGWKIVTNLLNMPTGGPVTGGVASQYWMVGAYLPIGANGPADGISDAFKVSGFTATRAVPEPGSIALFGIAGLAFAASRRRRARKD